MCIVTQRRPALFRGRHFEDVIILLCVRWYLRYSLTYRDLEEIMAERNLCVDHVTIWRWVQRYAPVLNQRIRREMRNPNRSWRVDETYVKVAGNWAYLYRAVDSAGETIEFMLSPKRDLIAAKLFLRFALSGGRPSPRVINVDGHAAYASAIAELKQSGELGRRCRVGGGEKGYQNGGEVVPCPVSSFGVSLSLFSEVLSETAPEQSRARRFWSRRSEPLTARTVLR
jgi:IS6 family transposase